jgi:hypothetical protein
MNFVHIHFVVVEYQSSLILKILVVLVQTKKKFNEIFILLKSKPGFLSPQIVVIDLILEFLNHSLSFLNNRI